MAQTLRAGTTSGGIGRPGGRDDWNPEAWVWNASRQSAASVAVDHHRRRGTRRRGGGPGVGGVARRETRPTLDPARFVGKARTAHQVAREVPDILDQLYCYCECDKHMGHKSLLSCYTDGHAATC